MINVHTNCVLTLISNKEVLKVFDSWKEIMYTIEFYYKMFCIILVLNYIN